MFLNEQRLALIGIVKVERMSEQILKQCLLLLLIFVNKVSDKKGIDVIGEMHGRKNFQWASTWKCITYLMQFLI